MSAAMVIWNKRRNERKSTNEYEFTMKFSDAVINFIVAIIKCTVPAFTLKVHFINLNPMKEGSKVVYVPDAEERNLCCFFSR